MGWLQPPSQTKVTRLGRAQPNVLRAQKVAGREPTIGEAGGGRSTEFSLNPPR